jgi:hypothetical protein
MQTRRGLHDMWLAFLLWFGLVEPEPVKAPGKKPGAKPVGPRNRDGSPFTGLVVDGEVVPPGTATNTSTTSTSTPQPSTGGDPMSYDDGSPTNAPEVQSGGIFTAVTEEMNRLRDWEPTNESSEVTAGAVRQFLAELPGFLESMSGVLGVVAEKVSEVVEQQDGGPEVLQAMSSYVGAAVDPLREVAIDWDQINQDNVARMTSENAAAAAWDWGRHPH